MHIIDLHCRLLITMEFTLHRDFKEIDPNEWNGLLNEAVTNSPFLRHEYQAAWWSTLGGGEWNQAELVLLSANENGRLLGIAPLFLTGYEGRPTLLLCGSIEISDYLDVIVRHEDVDRFITGLLDYLTDQRNHEWLALDWYNIPDSSPVLPALKTGAEQRKWTQSLEVYRPTPYIPLSDGFESYLARIEKKQRHEIRRKLRRIEEGGNQVRWYISDGSDLESEIDSLLTMMADDPNKAGFLTERMRAQMRASIQSAHAAGWLWLVFLEINGRRAAAALNFDYNGRLWGYNSGVDRSFLEWSPGWVLLSHSLKWAAENGRKEFDFMRGDEEYKYRFGAMNRYVMRIKVVRE